MLQHHVPQLITRRMGVVFGVSLRGNARNGREPKNNNRPMGEKIFFAPQIVKRGCTCHVEKLQDANASFFLGEGMSCMACTRSISLIPAPRCAPKRSNECLEIPSPPICRYLCAVPCRGICNKQYNDPNLGPLKVWGLHYAYQYWYIAGLGLPVES
ncbi:hypothetical protein ABW19_dt0209386 [Dactylella cylindrospora]|nr:hypothetical protein ABW19_dt0209386 [Dactylella cylindrospora]